jgi:diguanylate cyclase (GGDEF)-like protein
VSNEQLILLLLVAVVANVVLSAAYLLVPSRTRNEAGVTDADADLAAARANADAGRTGRERNAPVSEAQTADAVAERAALRDTTLDDTRPVLGPASYDRVVRIVSYAFLASAAAVVAVSGLYPRAAPAVYAVLGLAGLLVLLVHDVLPSAALGPGKLVLEGSGAIALVTVLIALTGGADSPFFLGYYLIVAGAALVVRGPATFVVAAAISAVYLLAILALPGFGNLAFEQLMRVVFNLVSLWLLSYLASVVAREQQRSRDAAVRMSLVDPLTRLGNRNFFRASMEREIQRHSRTNRRFCLLMIDMDDLKPINDTFGHHHGDRMLRTVGEVIQSGIRTIDSAARFGGDEFVVLLPDTDPAGGLVVAEKLRESISKARLDANGRPVQTTVSIGVVAYPDDGRSADELFMAADATMYESKRKGKNRVAGRLPARARRAVEREVRRAEGTGAQRPRAGTTGRQRGRPAPTDRPRVDESERGRGTSGRSAAGGRPPRNAPASVPRPYPAPDQGSRSHPGRRRRIPGTDGDEGGTPRATRRFQVLGDVEEEQIGRIMRQLLGPPTTPRPIGALEPAAQGDADNRPA